MVDDSDNPNDGIVDAHVVDLDGPDVVEGHEEGIVPEFNLSQDKHV